MSETLLAILTDQNARQTKQIRANLDQEFSAGKPWFDKAS
jgi:hypothetical protein